MIEGRAERRLVTCLFIDIVSSTELTVSIGPERMRRLVDEAFAAMSALIVARGGTIEKFVGDAIFVLFGAPVSHADDAERALRAAEACARWAAERHSTTPVAIRIGVESGEALVDIDATERTRQRMAVGGCVNLAARLQALAEPGEILVGPSCHAATEYVAEFDAARRVAPKGLDAVEAWPLARVTGTLRASLPFVGRARELELLRNAYGGVCEGRARLALVIGPPGQGKSRLVSEVVAPLRREATVLEARCRPGEESGSGTPLRQLLASDIGEPSTEKIELRLKELLPQAKDVAPTASAIAHSAGLTVDQHVIALPRLEQRDLLTSAWRRYLEALAVVRPVVLWIEDIHWADALVLRLIDRASADVASCLLVLATARPEFVGSAHFRPSDDRIEIELGPLGQAESVALARSASPVDEAVVRRAQGNPLFIVELARARLSSTDVPVSVQAVIGARLDELPPADRGLLQHASVVGDTFTVRDAALLSDREPTEVAAALGRLSHLRFIEPVGRSYRFHHVLVHDVAYGRLAAEERLRLHARYAREGLHPGDAEALAHHWWQALGSPDAEWVWADAAERATMRREALHAHLAAASRLIERNAQERALEVSKRAVSLADDVADVAVAETALGMAFARNARGDEAWEHRNRALEAYRRAGTTPASLYADMLEIPTFNFGYFRDLPADLEVARLLADGISLARTSKDDLSLARLLTMRAVLAQDANAGLEATRLIRAATDPAAYSEALARRAQVEVLVGEGIDTAIELFDETMARAAAGMPINEPEALMWQAVLAYHAGKLDLARRLADRLIQLSPSLSAHTQQHGLGCRALVLFGTGDWDALGSVAREMEQLVDANPDAGFCLVGAAGIGQAAAGAVLHGRGASARLGELVDRMVKQALPVRASIRMLPEAMAGNAEMVTTARDAYGDSVAQFGRQVWDRFGVQLAISFVMLGRWSDVDPLLARFDEQARRGGQMLSALGAAIREERAAASGGPRPTHRELRDLGYRGLSELLSFRPAARATRGP